MGFLRAVRRAWGARSGLGPQPPPDSRGSPPPWSARGRHRRQQRESRGRGGGARRPRSWAAVLRVLSGGGWAAGPPRATHEGTGLRLGRPDPLSSGQVLPEFWALLPAGRSALQARPLALPVQSGAREGCLRAPAGQGLFSVFHCLQAEFQRGRGRERDSGREICRVIELEIES